MNRNSASKGHTPVSRKWRFFDKQAAAFALTLALGGFPSMAPAASLTKVSGIVPGYSASNQTEDMPTADFDGDGLKDIVVIGSLNYGDVLQIVGVQSGQGWKIKQAITPDSGDYFYTPANIATWTDTAGAHLVYVRGNSISEYGGWPLTLQRHFVLEGYVQFSDVLVADVDNNGVFELVTASNDSQQAIAAYSLDTGALLWSVPLASYYDASLHVAQLDADPALEILLTGTPGLVVDGATRAVEWTYKDGFGALMEHGRFGGPPSRFASLGYRLVMFQGNPWSPLWDLNGIDAQASAIADIDGDQIDELISSTRSFPRGISIIDVQTQSQRAFFEDGFVEQVAAADFDGDLAIEIAAGIDAQFGQANSYAFRVFNATTGSNEFGITARAPGPFLAGGFVADSGTLDVIVGSASGSDLDGTIACFDSASGAVRWRTAANDPLINLNSVKSLLVASIPGQPQPVVVASGRGNFPIYNEVVALRASDGSALWHINASTSPVPDSVSFEAIAAIDLDGNAQTDALLACTSESRLRLFNAVDQTPIWTSVAMSGACKGALQMPSNGQQQLVAVLSNALRAYDAQSHLLSWSLPYPYELTGASYLPHGVSGPEIALFQANMISFYDADTRTLLRELNFPDQYFIQAIVQPPGASIHDLLVSFDNTLQAVDGVSGTVTATSEPLGLHTGQFNQLPVYSDPDGSVRVAAGSEVAVSTYRLAGLSDAIFANGFESATP